MPPFFSRFCHSPITRLAAITLVALAWSSIAFCGEIHDAAQSGDLKTVQALIKANPDLVFSPSDSGFTPLHLAAGGGHKDVVEFLLKNKAKVDARDKLFGGTPLH